MNTRIALGLAVLLLSGAWAEADTPAAVKVTQRRLQPLCLDGAPVAAGARSWSLPAGPHTLGFTIREDKAAAVDPKVGAATISFTLEAGHKYEVEVRAPAASYSTRTWERGQWKPVVRDRTVDHLVSGEPEWSDGGCPADRRGCTVGASRAAVVPPDGSSQRRTRCPSRAWTSSWRPTRG